MIRDNCEYFKSFVMEWPSIFLGLVADFSRLLACTANFMFNRKWCEAPLALQHVMQHG